MLQLLLCLLAHPLFGEEWWYKSNAGGLALEPVFSRLALRNKYALKVSTVTRQDVPAALLGYLYPGFRPQLRVLYQNGKESRRQWLFIDGDGKIRVTAALPSEVPAENPTISEPSASETGSDSPAAALEIPAAEPETPAAALSSEPADSEAVDNSETVTDSDTTDNSNTAEKKADPEEGPDKSGFIEIYDPRGFLIEEHRIEKDGTDYITTYVYRRELLIRSETGILSPPEAVDKPLKGEVKPKKKPYRQDLYRYSRSRSLRQVERTFYDQGTEGTAQTLRFPLTIMAASERGDFVSPAQALSSDFFSDILNDSSSRILYKTDNRGKVLSETRKDEDGKVIGELINTWEGDRLTMVVWKTPEAPKEGPAASSEPAASAEKPSDSAVPSEPAENPTDSPAALTEPAKTENLVEERRTEYRYDDEGDRVEERDYHRGILERVVKSDGDVDVEELYMDGRVILRAHWEKGRKIREERVRE